MLIDPKKMFDCYRLTLLCWDMNYKKGWKQDEYIKKI